MSVDLKKHILALTVMDDVVNFNVQSYIMISFALRSVFKCGKERYIVLRCEYKLQNKRTIVKSGKSDTD